MTTAAIIINYNMPERTDALVEYIGQNVENPVECIVVDNCSDIKQPSIYTSVALQDRNVQTTNGWLMGLHYADALEAAKNYKFDYYWFLITSAEFTEGDPLTPMVEKMQSSYNIVGCHPRLTENSTTHWQHMKKSGKTWFIDNIASLYRAEWFNSIGRFDPALIYAWGIDLETCYKARQQGKELYICDDAEVKKVTDIGYKMDRMNMSAEVRRQKAGANMEQIFSERYGNGWHSLMYKA